MSAPDSPASKATTWLAGILASALLASITGLAGTSLSHERRLSTVETRQEEIRQQREEERQHRDRVERKIDRALSQLKP